MSSNIKRTVASKLESTVMFVASFALVLGSVSAAMPIFLTQTAEATAATSNFPSTNSQNIALSSRPSVSLVTSTADSVSLEFSNTTNSQAFFEYRIDGAIRTSGTLHYNPCKPAANPLHSACGGLRYIGDDEVYYSGGVSVDNRSTNVLRTSSVLRTIPATSKVEVRLALGGERNWDFDWTKFDVLPVPDTTAPRVAITSPTLNQAISGRTVTIKGTATDSDFNYYLCYVEDSHGEVGARDDSCTTTWHAVETAGTLGTVTLPSDLPDGNYVAHLVAYDKDHNVSEVTQAFVLDNTVPTKPVFTAPENNLFTKINAVTLTWSNGDDSGLNQSGIKGYTIRYTFVPMDGGATVEWTSGIITNGNPKTHSGTYGHGQGTYTMYVSTVDNAGNVSPESDPLILNYDATTPVATITAPTMEAVSGHILNIEGTATDANFNYYHCYVTNANGEVGIRDPQCVTAWSAGSLFHSAFAATVTGTTFGHLGTVDLTGLSSGTYQVHILAYDKAGNSTEATQQFILDNTPPKVTINPHGNVASGERVTFTGDIDDPTSTLELSIGGMTFNPLKDAGGGTWSYVMDTATLNAGTYTAVISAIDQAGNASIASGTATSTLLITPPDTADSGRLKLPTTTLPIPSSNPNPIVADNPQQATSDNNQEAKVVLGAETKNDTKGSTDKVAALAATDNGWSIFGLMWYWWALIAAAIAAAWWIISAAIRRRGQGAQ